MIMPWATYKKHGLDVDNDADSNNRSRIAMNYHQPQLNKSHAEAGDVMGAGKNLFVWCRSYRKRKMPRARYASIDVRRTDKDR